MRLFQDNTSVFAQYTILSEERESIHNKLQENKVPSVSYYSVPLHLQPVFKNLAYQVGDFPVAENFKTMPKFIKESLFAARGTSKSE